MNGKKLEIKLVKKLKNMKINLKILFTKNEKLRSFNNSIEKIKKDYLKNPKPLATRKSSEIFLEYCL